MKPTVKVWPIPRLKQSQFEKLLKDIVDACKKIDLLQVHSEDDIITGFPRDDMNYGLGTVLVVEVGIPKALFKKLTKISHEEVCDMIAMKIGVAVRKFFYRRGFTPSVQYEGRLTHGGTLDY